MTAETVINLAYVAVLLLAGVVLVRLCRRPSEAERVAAARRRVGLRVWDTAADAWVALPPGMEPGPGQLTDRDIDEADRLELLYLAPAYDPAWDAGLERLHDAARDHTNTPEGDS